MSTKFKYTALCFLVLLGTRLLCAPGGPETDSTKSKYAITDPRNPNCPCHQYQAIADKEYARLTNKGENKGSLAVKGADETGRVKLKKVHNHKWFWASTKGHKVKEKKRKCFRDRLSRCFHF